MDTPTRAAVAQAIFNGISPRPLRNLVDVVDVEIHQVDTLTAQVRVKCTNGAPRYFTVKASEPWS